MNRGGRGGGRGGAPAPRGRGGFGRGGYGGGAPGYGAPRGGGFVYHIWIENMPANTL